MRLILYHDASVNAQGDYVSDDSSKISVCLCLSGQMRNFEHNFNWLKTLDPRIIVSVTVATWAQRGGKLWGGMVLRRMRGLFPDGVADALPRSWMTGDMLEHLPGVREAALDRAFKEPMTVDKIQKILPGAIAHIEEPLKFSWFERSQFETGNTHARDPFSLSMLYKIWQADLLRKNLEAEQGFKFDVVIRARPDLPFEVPQYSFLKHIKDNELYLDRFQSETRTAGDSFALGNSKSMDVFSEFFMFAYQKSIRGKWRYIHSDLYDYIADSGLAVRSYPILMYSQDRLVETSEVVSAIRDRQKATNLPIGYTIRDDKDCALICTSVQLAERLMRQEAKLDDKETLDHIESVLSQFDIDRDGGLFGVLAKCFDLAKDTRTSMLCFALSIQPDIDGDLSEVAIERYISELFPLLQTAAREGFALNDPLALLEKCIEHTPVLRRVRELISRQLALGLLQVTADRYRQIQNSLFTMPGHAAWFVEFYEQREEYSAAEALIHLGLAKSPKNGHLQARLAFLYAAQGREYDAAAAAAGALETPEAWVQFLSGKALLRIGWHAEAENAFRRAIKLYPADADYYLELSNALYRQGKHDEAIQVAHEAASRSPENMAHRHNHLGHILLGVGRLGDAELAFREALRRAPKWHDVRAQLSRIIASQNRFGDAAAIELEYAELQQGPESSRAAIIQWLRLAEGDGTAPLLKRAALLWPDDPEVQELLKLVS